MPAGRRARYGGGVGRAIPGRLYGKLQPASTHDSNLKKSTYPPTRPTFNLIPLQKRLPAKFEAVGLERGFIT